MSHYSFTLYGHNTFLERFLQNLEQGTLHHAWLLTGPKGIGKRLVAENLTRFLLKYPNPPYPTSLSFERNDPIFYQLQAGSHPDVMFIEKGEDTLSQSKSFITVDAIRHVTHQLAHTSQTGGWKIILIDSLDDANEKAQNALLKTLEEPGLKTIFFLLYHGKNALLPTIRSRCQEVHLKPLSLPDMNHFVDDHFPNLPAIEKEWGKQLAQGRIGLFKSIVEKEGFILMENLMQGVLEVLQKKSPPYPICFKIAQTLSKEEDDRLFLFAYLFSWYLHTIAERLATGIHTPLAHSPEEKHPIPFKSIAFEQWMPVHEKALKNLREWESLKLDTRQMILSCFSSLGGIG